MFIEVFSRETSKGKLNVRVQSESNGARGPWIVLFVGSRMECVRELESLPTPITHNGRSATKHAQKIVLFADEVAMIEAAVKQVAESLPAPEVKDAREAARRSLAESLAFAIEEDERSMARAWERADDRGGVTRDRNGLVAAARKALADFDAAK